jgi:hypothetical protein
MFFDKPLGMVFHQKPLKVFQKTFKGFSQLWKTS